MTHLNLYLLGPFQVCLNDDPITNFESDKARALLAFLACERTLPHNRSRLAALFWPEWPENSARANLRAALAKLRVALRDRSAQPSLLIADRQTIQLNSEGNYYLDIEDFVDCVGAATVRSSRQLSSQEIELLQRATTLYRGSFLEGFSLNGCPDFEEWMLLVRERLQRQMLETHQHLGKHFEELGDYAQAAHHAQRQIDVDPLQEHAVRQLMRNLALLGERSAALVAYEKSRQMLWDELSIEPGAKTLALHDQIRREQFVSPDLIANANETEVNGRAIGSPGHISDGVKHNLPAPVNSFIGRDAERGDVCQLLRRNDVRLVTLTGPGGIGKTRLALEAARELIPHFVDGVFIVELAGLRDPNGVLGAMAQTLGVGESGSRSLSAALQMWMRNKQIMLLLDNFEHVIEAANLVGDLLASAAGLTVLSTSREALRLYGEHEFPLAPLPLPSGRSNSHADQMRDNDSVRLFVQRAHAANHALEIDEGNAQYMAKICTHLDGVPLAIELAAARLRYDSLDLLFSRLQERRRGLLAALDSGPRNVMPRHQTMYDAIRWSYDLLSKSEQTTFRRISVFAGGGTMDAIQKICCWEDAELSEVQTVIHSLCDKSLIRPVLSNGEQRYVLLEPIRAFGLNQLIERNEDAAVLSNHARYYVALVEEFDTQFRGGGQPSELVTIRLEQHNLRAALKWALDNGESELALRLAGDMTTLWESDGFYSEGLAWSRRVIQLAQREPPSDVVLKALWYTGFLALGLGDVTAARSAFQRCLQFSHHLQNVYWQARGLTMLANVAFNEGKYAEMRSLDVQRLRLDTAAQDDWTTGMFLTNMGGRLAGLGEFEEARHHIERGLSILQGIQNRYGITVAVHALGRLCAHEGDRTSARKLYRQAKLIAEETGHQGNWANVISSQARLTLEDGQYDEARALAIKALELIDRSGKKIQLAGLIDLFAALDVSRHRPEGAVHLAYAAISLRASLGVILPPVEQAQFDDVLRRAQEQLTEEEVSHARFVGETMTISDAVAYAML